MMGSISINGAIAHSGFQQDDISIKKRDCDRHDRYK